MQRDLHWIKTLKNGESLQRTSFRQWLLFLFFIGGFLVHTFTIKLGLNIKLFHFALLSYIFIILVKKQYVFEFDIINKIVLFFSILLMFLILVSNTYSIFSEKSLLYSIYLILTVLFSLLFLFMSEEFIENFNLYIKVYIIIMLIAIIGYIYIFLFVDISQFASDFKNISSRKEVVNSIYAFVFPEYGGLFLRFNGYNLDPNFWGLYAMVSFWILILFNSLAIKNRIIYSRSLYKFAIFLSIVSIIITFSRGTILSLIFSLGIFSLFSLNRKYIKKYFFYIISMIVIFLLLYYSIDIVKEAIDIKTSDVGTKNPRVEKWVYYLDVIWDDSLWRIFFGYGLIDLFTWYHGTTMHNTYIQIFISLGLVGLVSIIAFILVSIISIFLKYIPEYSSIQLALLSSVLVSILTIDMFYNSAFWIGLFLPFYSLKFTAKEEEI